MEFLIACDLEGVHGVVGEPYKTLNETPAYQVAIEGAQKEINMAARALFDRGAKRVIVWDNHGGGGNLDFSKLDERVEPANPDADLFRGDFAKRYHIDGILFLGYHAKEGSQNGVLAHTYNSKNIQYVKLNGTSIGELYTDSRIFADMGIKPIFHAGDDVSAAEMKAVCQHAVTVITKYGKGRNRAVLCTEEDVLHRIYEGVLEAVGQIAAPYTCTFPHDARLEIRYTRSERAAEVLVHAQKLGMQVSYGEDTHVLCLSVEKANQIPLLL